MTGVELSTEQRKVVESDEAVVLALGSAGTGKTTTALQAACRLLASGTSNGSRALFLTFSRTAAAQLRDRMLADPAVAEVADRIELSTFHAFALRMLRAFGDRPGVMPISAAQEQLLGQREGEITYSELVPEALRVIQRRSVTAVLRDRWCVVVCDEFQDTNDEQWELLELLSGWSRLRVMADPHQTIYDRLPGNRGHRMGRQRIDDLRERAVIVNLPPASYRDPTNVLPTAAEKIRIREFTADAVRDAVRSNRIRVRRYSGAQEDHCERVVDELRVLAQTGNESVGVFLHGTDAVAELSAQLTERHVTHLVAGLNESHGEALRAQAALIGFVAEAVSHDVLRERLATFASATRRRTPEVAHMLVGSAEFTSAALESRLEQLESELQQLTDFDQALEAVCAFWPSLNIRVGQVEWQRAAGTFRVLTRGVVSLADSWRRDVERVISEADHVAGNSFMSAGGATSAAVRLMNLHQTKGREFGAAVLVFSNGDFFGTEASPYPAASRLLYVALTRARKEVTILLPTRPHSLVAPLQQYVR